MAIIGITMSFLPDEIILELKMEPNPKTSLLIQIMGAMYFAFATIIWFAKGFLIGGNYGKPIVIGKFAHFAIASLAILKALPAELSLSVWLITLCYLSFALVFGYMNFTSPVKVNTANQ